MDTNRIKLEFYKSHIAYIVPVDVGLPPPPVVVPLPPPDLGRYLIPELGQSFFAKLGASARGGGHHEKFTVSCITPEQYDHNATHQ